MKQLVTFFILTIIFYYTTLFLCRCISSEYKKIKVREFVEGFEELSKDKTIEGMRGRRSAARNLLQQRSKLIGAIATAATARKIAAEAKATEAEAKKQEAINEGKEIERKQAADEARADFQKDFLAEDGDDGSGDFFEDQNPDFFKRDPNEQAAPENEEQLRMAFEFKQRQLEEQEEIARNTRNTIMIVAIVLGVLLLAAAIIYFVFIRKKGKKTEVKTSSAPEVEAPKVEAPKVEAPAPKS